MDMNKFEKKEERQESECMTFMQLISYETNISVLIWIKSQWWLFLLVVGKAY